MTLADLKIGQDAVLRTIGGQGELRHHLLDMGLTPGTEVTLRKVAPMGDPIEVELRGYELTLRLDDAAEIEVENVHETDRAARSEERHTAVPHPGVGELRKAPSYHDRKSGAEIPKGQPLRFALAGNQNCGKTTLFNQLTGSNQHVGNFPGVTVDRKDGVIRGHAEATVTDLPGIYSLSPYSSEEIVTRDFLLNTHPDGIINIVDCLLYTSGQHTQVQQVDERHGAAADEPQRLFGGWPCIEPPDDGAILLCVHRGILPEIIVQYKNNILQKACQTAGQMFIIGLQVL